MKLIFPIILSLFIITTIPGIYAESVPDWVKNTAGWWATDVISEKEFVNAIEFLANEGIIIVESTNSSKSSESVPDWVKNTAGWWATDAISENEFVNAIEFLANEGIISVKDSMSSQQKAEKLFKESVYKIPNSESYAEINSHGFRGIEITKEKPDDVFRIFAVGGSTTFSVGVEDEFTWPFLLEKKISELNPKSDVQVINAGIPSARSLANSILIEQKLIQFDPDLMIIYEGVNDQDCLMPPYHNKNTLSTQEIIIQQCGVYALQDYPIHLAERYSEVCGLAKQNNFKVIVAFQPVVRLDGKILTTQELDAYFYTPHYSVLLDDYDLMVSETLDNITGCYKTADLTKVFDSYDVSIYQDYHHLGNTGNSIIADNMKDLVIPLLINEEIIDEDEGNIPKAISKKLFDLKNMENADFSNKIIKNESFFATDLSNSNFSNSELDKVDLRLSNLEGANFKDSKLNDIDLRQNILKNADFTNVDFKNTDLTNVDLSYTDLENTNLADKDLRRTFLHKSNLNGADLSNSNLDNSFLHGVDFTNADLSYTKLFSVDFSMIKNKDLSTAKLLGTGMGFSDLRGVEMPNEILYTNLENANMNGIDFTDRRVIGGVFADTHMQNADLSNANLSPITFDKILYDFGPYPPIGIPENEIQRFIISKSDANLWTIWATLNLISVEPVGNDLHVKYLLYNSMQSVDLSNANLRDANLIYVDFYNANLSNANLSNSILLRAYLLNANLEGANLEGANLEGANLEGANLEGANLKCINHEICE